MEPTIAELKARIGRSRDSVDQTTQDTYTIPEWFLPIEASASALSLLNDYNSANAVADGRATVRFDPRLNRLVFLCKDDIGRVIGAAGRALDRTTKPKWFKYKGENAYYCVPGSHRDCPSGRLAVVVEDPFSACAVSCVGDGVALLGTTLRAGARKVLSSGYKEIIVALDKDASKKAVTIASELRWVTDGTVRVVVLQRDLKYEPPDNITKVLGI